MGVIHRVHRDTADMRLSAQVPNTSSLPMFDVLVVRIRNLANCRSAIRVEDTDFSRREPDVCPITFFANQFGGCPRGSSDFTPAPWREFQIMQDRSQGDPRQRHRVPDTNFGGVTRLDGGPNLEFHRSNDVTLLSIFVVQKGNPCRTIWIVFASRHASGNAILASREVDDSISPLMSSTTKP
jgi:hypothetical protein